MRVSAGVIGGIGGLRLTCGQARGYNPPSAGLGLAGWRDGPARTLPARRRGQGRSLGSWWSRVEKGCDTFAPIAQSTVRYGVCREGRVAQTTQVDGGKPPPEGFCRSGPGPHGIREMGPEGMPTRLEAVSKPPGRGKTLGKPRG